MIILLNMVLLLLVIASLASAYILIYVLAGDFEKFNVELRDTYIVMTDDYDRGFTDKLEALDFAALHSGIVISVKTGDTVADFTTIDYNPFIKEN